MSKEQPEAIIFEKIKRLCRNANCAYTVMNYYETVIIPARLKTERERVIEKVDKRVFYATPVCYLVGSEDRTCGFADPIEDKRTTCGPCEYGFWQQLKQQEGI